jgi:ABC-type dipeptide/oligopeptide/nickel transport system ATPase component
VNGENPLLSVHISVDYPGRPGVLENLSLEMQGGEVLGLVGQSGSGKSTLALAILRLLSLKGGSVRGDVQFAGRNLMQLPEREMRELRGREISLVLQSPLTALNSVLRVGKQLAEAWRAHSSEAGRARAHALASALESVSLPSDEGFLRRYPSQLSVGQAQRVLIAMAILHRPALLICDEPTSALDAVTQSEILELFARLNRTLGMTLLYISHDLLSVSTLCQRVAILHEGRIVESGTREEVFCSPRNPYTRRLLEALPLHPGLLAGDKVLTM